jgi:lambda family phage portal protein
MAVRVSWLDRAIASVAPGTALRRVRQRAAFDLAARNFDAAGSGRSGSGWKAIGSSADAIIGAAAATLRDRNRELVRNNPHAAKAVSSLTTNIVGSGIMPRPNTGNEATDKQIADLWEDWSRRCDADGQLDFYGLQTLAVREMIEGGEVLLRRRPRRASDGVPGNLQVQLVEADLLDPGREGPQQDGGSTFAVQGVAFDGIGRRVGYWLYPAHPRNNYVSMKMALQSALIPAEDVIHLYEKQRTQVRGIPWGTPAMQSLRDLGDYETAELVRKKIEACMVGIVTGGDENDMGVGISLEGDERPGVYDKDGVAVERFEPGMFAYARGGRDIKFSQPAATGTYDTYKRSMLHTVAAGYRLPYELLTGDLSQVNYSSIRAGLIEFRRLVETVQWQIVIPTLCQRIWDWFVLSHQIAGLIKLDRVPVKWSTPKFWSVDPVKDATADLLMLRTGSKSLQEVIAENGRNPTDVLNEIKETWAMLDKLGLVLDSDPRSTTKNGQLQVAINVGGSEAPGDSKP